MAEFPDFWADERLPWTRLDEILADTLSASATLSLYINGWRCIAPHAMLPSFPTCISVIDRLSST